MSESSVPGIKNIGSFRNYKNVEAAEAQYGRLPPQALELEEAVLGAIMLDKDAISVVVDILQEESFYRPANNKIYKAMRGLFAKSQPIDLLTVTEALRKEQALDDIGGVSYLLQLNNKVASSANIEFHARIVAQKFIQRELIRLSNDVILDSYEDTKDVFDILDKAEQGLYEITEKNLRRGYKSVGALTREVQKKLEELQNKTISLTGIPSGFPDLDKITSGWQNSDLIIVAARPGMGKTAFVLGLARNAAKDYNKPVAFFSLEMSSVQLVQRLISSEAELDNKKLRTADMAEYEWVQLNNTIQQLSEIPIYIDDTPALNVFELRAKCRRLKQMHNISMVVVDYLQLMTVNSNDKRGGNREQEISTISRALKGLAKELDLPVIALSQLSRAVETRGGNKKPQLSDLRESGAIEQDADMVLFIYRPDYYELEDSTSMDKGESELIIAKHRNGATGSVKVRFIDRLAKFEPVSQFDFAGKEISGVSPFNSQVQIISSRINNDDDIPF